jgi:hypothetical protein
MTVTFRKEGVLENSGSQRLEVGHPHKNKIRNLATKKHHSTSAKTTKCYD